MLFFPVTMQWMRYKRRGRIASACKSFCRVNQLAGANHPREMVRYRQPTLLCSVTPLKPKITLSDTLKDLLKVILRSSSGNGSLLRRRQSDEGSRFWIAGGLANGKRDPFA